LGESQFQEVKAVLRRTPGEVGLTGTLWNGKALRLWIGQRYRVHLGLRQCQRMFRQFGFRLRKPRPLIGYADPELSRDA
jgi:transposase